MVGVWRVKAVRRKLVNLVATLGAVSVLTFLLTTLLPGDPAASMLGPNGVTKESLAAVREKLHLDDSLLSRYGSWLNHILHGDLGFSYVTRSSVSSQLKTHLPVTLEIIVLAMVIALVISIPAGIFSAYRAGRVSDHIVSVMTFIGLAVPGFVVALVLILVFAVRLDLLPASGWVQLTKNPVDNLRSAFLPALSLALPQIAVFGRLLRSDMITTLRQDFVSMAESKGLSTARILFGHAFRPSSFSLVTVVGLQLGFLLGGTVIVEAIFSLPGIGQLLVSAIYSRDLIMVQGLTLFIATAFVVVNFLVDLLYSVLDPRIRRGGLLASV